MGWAKYSHEQLGINSFGASAPYKQVYEKFGITGSSQSPSFLPFLLLPLALLISSFTELLRAKTALLMRNSKNRHRSSIGEGHRFLQEGWSPDVLAVKQGSCLNVSMKYRGTVHIISSRPILPRKSCTIHSVDG